MRVMVLDQLRRYYVTGRKREEGHLVLFDVRIVFRTIRAVHLVEPHVKQTFLR